MFQSLTGIATDQLALSLQEVPSSNAMEMGKILQVVGHEWMLLKLMAMNERRTMKALRIGVIPAVLVLSVGIPVGQDAAHDLERALRPEYQLQHSPKPRYVAERLTALTR
jgi:O-acetylhomoserine/O-acetylserine sulfhydrylase-like pyridoxal-dependent enzyme